MEIVYQLRPRASAIKGSRLLLLGLLSLVPVVWWRLHQSGSPATVFEPSIQPLTSEPLCPWRQPNEDLKSLFPQATGYEVETRILSGFRTQLGRQLGRTPTGDE